MTYAHGARTRGTTHIALPRSLMSLPSGTSFLRTPIGRLAVTGAATLVTLVGVAPTAMADEDLAPETSSTDRTTTESSDVEPSLTSEQEQEALAEEPPAGDAVDGPASEDVAAPAEEPVEVAPTEDEAEPAAEAAPGPEVAAADTELVLADDTGDVTAGRTGTFYVLQNDTSTDAIRSLTIESQGEHGTAYVVGSRFEEPGQDVPGEGSLRIEFDADEDYVGTDSFTYRVTTVDGTTATATVDLQVEALAEPVAPQFGTTKFRVGVQLADGSYAPEGTAGGTFRIQEIRPDGSTPDPQSCTTFATFQFGPGSSRCSEFEGNPGSTYVITQESAAAGVVASPRRRVIDPCDTSPGGSTEYCFFGPFGDSAVALFTNAGSILPEAEDDSATSDGGEPVDVDVLANDDSEDPNTELEVATQPDGGTAELVGEAAVPVPVPDPEDRAGILAVPTAGTQRIRYTPEPGFEGVDTFTYRLTNGNGSDTATVSVLVGDNGAVTPVDPTDPDDSDDGENASDGEGAGSGGDRVRPAAAGLPSTGGPDAGLLALGGALLATGAVAVAGSRRRRDAAGA